MPGGTVTYSCTNPAFFIADDVATCQADGTWIPDVIEMCEQIGELKMPRREKKIICIAVNCFKY